MEIFCIVLFPIKIAKIRIKAVRFNNMIRRASAVFIFWDTVLISTKKAAGIMEQRSELLVTYLR